MLTSLPASRLRWSCPRSWVRPLDGDAPPELAGLDELVDGLRQHALTHAPARPRHLLLVVPGWADWAAPATAWLRACGARATRLGRPDKEHLRGKDGPGALAGAHGGLAVLDAADLGEGGAAAVAEALRLGRIERIGGKRSDEARFGLVLLATDAAIKKLAADHPRLIARCERLQAPADVARDRHGAGALAHKWRHELRVAGHGEASEGALAWLVSQTAVGARRRRLQAQLPGAIGTLAEARVAQPDGAISVRSVRAAWRARQLRAGVAERAHRRRLGHGQLLVRASGSTVGVVNGLMVYGGGKRPYCIPGRITARAGVGRQGLINVEREAKYSGRSYDKGVLQLHSLLRGEFARKDPLGLAAALAFEQSYGNVDGDSATLAKAAALFSDITGLPARQGVAVTGSVNHRGELQPVGSIALKVEGWWAACQALETDATPGVLLPSANAEDLQLDERVVAAVRAGRFEVWTADTLGDALELLLGVPWDGQDGVLARARKQMAAWSARLSPPRPAKGKAKPKPAKAEPPPTAKAPLPADAPAEEAPAPPVKGSE